MIPFAFLAIICMFEFVSLQLVACQQLHHLTQGIVSLQFIAARETNFTLVPMCPMYNKWRLYCILSRIRIRSAFDMRSAQHRIINHVQHCICIYIRIGIPVIYHLRSDFNIKQHPFNHVVRLTLVKFAKPVLMLFLLALFTSMGRLLLRNVHLLHSFKNQMLFFVASTASIQKSTQSPNHLDNWCTWE